MSLINDNLKQTFSRKNNYNQKSDVFEFNSHQKLINNKLNNDNFNITRINIDSRYRSIIPKNKIDIKNSLLPNNPLVLYSNSDLLYIYHPNHNFNINDKIIITNCIGNKYYLKTLEFFKNLNYVKIYHPDHNMIYSANIDYYISINNIQGITILNIPTNLLNDIHKVYFNTDESTTYNTNYYFIKIYLLPNNNYTYSNNIFTVEFYHIAGIPINYINANYPITYYQNQGFQTISSVINTNWYTIKLPISSISPNIFTQQPTNNIPNNIISYGGANISISKIINIFQAYPNNNNYSINLNKTFYNVKKIKLISTEFPNTEKVIKDSPSIKQNNLFYWKLLNDGDYLYKVAIIPGNYTINSLISTMTTQIESIDRINKIYTSNTKYHYNSKNSVSITIDNTSNIFSITFFDELIIDSPFTFQKKDNEDFYYIQVYHPNHNLEVGTSVVINNAIDFYIFPSSVLNDTFTIIDIIDNDYYSIKLKKFNPLTSATMSSNIVSSGGGIGVSLKYPIYAKLYFNQPNTIGNILGFRNVGSTNAITSWSLTNSNSELYQLDTDTDFIGIKNKTKYINNYINLNGDNYILMASNLFEKSSTYGNIKGVFAKILLAGVPGSILYNQYIQLSEELTQNITSISNIQFTFYSPDGTLYDFYNIDHSFTLEIYEEFH